jgi:hypothetical protein
MCVAVMLFDFTLPAAVGLLAAVYDEEEEPISDWTAACQCVGIEPGSGPAFLSVARLAQLNPAYARRTRRIRRSWRRGRRRTGSCITRGSRCTAGGPKSPPPAPDAGDVTA